MDVMRSLRWLLLCLFLPWWLSSAPADEAPLVLVVPVKSAIGPASQDRIVRTLADAGERGAELVVIQLDTPGGLDFSMREIISAILASPVPVATFVAPPGARAASAGTYILYASHIAAMAPATHLGAATPVRLGGASPSPPEGDAGEEKNAGGDAMNHKLLNDAVAYIRGLAKLRGRNVEWAERAVREAVTLTAEEALEQGVIDLIADDVPDLLARVDGRRVQVGASERVLHTRGARTEWKRPDWRSRLLELITDPNVAYVLMLIGIYGLILEFSNPGQVVPGVIGAIALLLALYAFQILPVSYAGVALIVLGLLFMIGEALLPTAGLLGLGGLAAFVFGSVILFDDEYLAVSLPLVGGTALVAGGFLLWLLVRVVGLRRRPPVTGEDALVGRHAEVVEDFRGRGRVRVGGELWWAESARPLRAGQRVRILEVDEGLVLRVAPEPSDS